MLWVFLGVVLVTMWGCALQQQASNQKAMEMRRNQEKEEADRLVAECQRIYLVSTLNSIRPKVFYTGQPSFDQLANEQYPTAEEKQAIREWATLAMQCAQKWKSHWQTYSTPMHVNLFLGFTESADGLRVQLHNGQITYGQYVHERQKLTRDFDSAWTQLNAELRRQDAEAQYRATQLSQQYYQNSLLFQQNLIQQQAAYQRQQGQQHGSVSCNRIGSYTYCNY